MPLTSARPFERLLTDRAICIVLTLLAAIVYTITLCPTIFTDDCGEIATAVTTWGVMHPTGYPLYCLVGGALVHILSRGEPAWRLGFLSVIPAAVTVGLIYTILRHLGTNRTWAAAGALTAAFSYNLWSQATKVETYALNAFFISLLLLLALNFYQTGERRWLLWCCVTAGLTATNHLSSLWMFPAIAILLISRLIRVPRPVSLAAIGVVCFLVPLNLYWYEMYAAVQHPDAQVWGDPSTPRSLIDHVTGVIYQGDFGHPSQQQSLAMFLDFGPAWLWANLGLLLPLAPFGIARIWRRDRPTSIMLITSVCCYLLVVVNYNIGNIHEYYTPLVLQLSVLGGIGGEAVWNVLLTRWLDNKAPNNNLLSALVILMCIVPIVLRWPVCDRSHARFVEQYGRNILSETPKNAVLVVYWDVSAFSLWYAQQVLGERRDVVVIDRGLLRSRGPNNRIEAWYFRKIDRRDPSLSLLQKLRRAATDINYAVTEGPLWDIVSAGVQKRRPILFVEAFPTDVTQYGGNTVLKSVQPPCVFQQIGLLHEVVPVEDQLPIDKRTSRDVDLIAQLKIEPVSDDVRSLGSNSESLWRIYGSAFTGVARDLLAQSRSPDAAKWAALAVDEDPESADALDAYATADLNLGQKDDAIALWRKAADLEPNNQNYRVKLNSALNATAQ